MNIQAMVKQAQQLQKNMMNEKNIIDSKEFIGKSSLVSVTMKGTRKIISVKVDANSLDSDDIDMLQDMFMVATNDALKQIDKEINDKMGKYTNGMPGLF